MFKDMISMHKNIKTSQHLLLKSLLKIQCLELFNRFHSVIDNFKMQFLEIMLYNMEKIVALLEVLQLQI